jgi:hypothetical protein
MGMNKVIQSANENDIVVLSDKMYRVKYVAYPGTVEHMNFKGIGAMPNECVYTCERGDYEPLFRIDNINNYTFRKRRDYGARAIQKVWKQHKLRISAEN